MAKKRRRYTTDYKFETVLESVRGEKSKAQICRERNITESLLYRWQQDFLEKGSSLFADSRQSGQETSQEEKIAELERMVGRLTMELETLKKSMSWLNTYRRKNGR